MTAPLPSFVDFSVQPARAGLTDRLLVNRGALHPPPLQIAIIYDDAPAGHRAMATLGGWEEQETSTVSLSPVLWRFDRLERLLSRCRASDDVLEADVVIISLSRPAAVPPAIEAWLSGCLQRKRGDYLTVLSLLDRHEASSLMVLRQGGCVALHPRVA